MTAGKKTTQAKAPAKAVKKEAVAVPPPAAAEPVVDAQPAAVDEPAGAPPVVGEDQVDTKFQWFHSKLAVMNNALKEMTAMMKTLQREYAKSVKSVTKRGRKGGAVKRSPSGFAKPALLSDELCDFLNIARGSQKARTDVTRMINEYIKSNNLQDKNDKRNINADASLKKIMNLKDGDVLSYFNLQKYIKHHFVTAKN